MIRPLLLTTVAALAGCATAPTIGDLMPFGGGEDEPRVRTGAVDQSARNDHAAGWDSAPAAEGTPVLYGRDGSPVGTAQPGVVVQSEEPINSGLGEANGSRVVLLDLYADVKRERDELLLEFDELAAENEAAAVTITEQKKRISSLEAEVAALTKKNGELDALQFELAGRLAQAQIARLEAERALLEASVEWRRMNAANSRAATTPQEPQR